MISIKCSFCLFLLSNLSIQSFAIPGKLENNVEFLSFPLPVILFLDDWGPSTILYVKDKVELYQTINNIISNCEYKIISIATLSEPTST